MQIGRIREVAGRFPDHELITSLTIFNNNVTRVWNRLLPGQLRGLTFFDYTPTGTTAMLDAVGEVISDMQRVTEPESLEIGATVVVVIITDGHENSSRTWSHEQVSSLIRELEKTGRWVFSYLGTTIDAVEIASGLNIRKENSMYFDIKDTFLMYNDLGVSLSSYVEKKESGSISVDFLGDSDE